MTTWELVGGNPAPGDTGAIAATAADMRRSAETVSEARERLRRMVAGGATDIWQGPAAQAFRLGIQPLQGDLGRAARSFGTVASALERYRRQLDDLQQRARALLAEAHRAQDAVGVAHRELSAARVRVDREVASAELGPIDTWQLRRDRLAPYEQAVGRNEAWLRGLVARAEERRGDHRGAASRAANTIAEAERLTVKSSFDDRIVGALRGFNEFVDDLSPFVAVASVALLAAAVAPAAVGAAGFAAAGYAGQALLALAGADLLARVVRLAKDDETMTDSVDDLALDLGALALPLGGSLASTGAAKAATHAGVSLEAGLPSVAILRVGRAARLSRVYLGTEAVGASFSVYEVFFEREVPPEASAPFPTSARLSRPGGVTVVPAPSSTTRLQAGVAPPVPPMPRLQSAGVVPVSQAVRASSVRMAPYAPVQDPVVQNPGDVPVRTPVLSATSHTITFPED